ncbi:MAG: hypothetical protein P9F19_01110 [Candidatus Contendobacter sp.]|nr:hypothetical protein [Candidatus Contendobacter sp.]MDG4555987.1 hypothetical protein [Candidatus Contendobacter sp.]
MPWFTASLITVIEVINQSQERIPVFEDFFLIEADDREKAIHEAEYIGQQQAALDDGICLDGKPAKRIFLGVRKIRSIYNPAPYDIDSDRPVHGTELTHSYFEAKDLIDAIRLAKGESVNISYIDDNDAEPVGEPVGQISAAPSAAAGNPPAK